jgi:uncharacterized HAD superfamily protein
MPNFNHPYTELSLIIPENKYNEFMKQAKIIIKNNGNKNDIKKNLEQLYCQIFENI